MTINVGLLVTYIVSLLIMVGFPIALAVFFTRRFKVSWWPILAGLITFVVSQGLRIPASSGLNILFTNGTIPVPPDAWIPFLNAAIAGLMAGFFEETCRYIGFRILRKKAKPYTSAIGLGIGHGGTEAILLGVLGTGISLFSVLTYNAGAQLASGTSTDQVSYVMAQIAQFWAAPWLNGLLPGVERIIALSAQILLSVLVWKAVVNRQALWFILAIFYHAVIDAVSVFLSQLNWNYWAIEGVLAIFLVANLYMIYYFWKQESEKEVDENDDDEDDDEDEDGEDEDDADDVAEDENTVEDEKIK
ncbi:MAG: YhfC family glutamic-type intramembrane protease [Chloroflexi bacterium]|nr:YhfC family glutamic-type intramembrane protease [Chloroflexota bacterium]